MFLFKRDTDDGVVRHWYRQQMQTSKKTQEDAYMPVNSSVPFKPMEVVTLKKTVSEMMHRFRDKHVLWWEDLIGKFEFEDLQSCSLCKEFRKTIMANASHCNDAKELQRTKGNSYRKASKELMAHMTQTEDAHPLFTVPNLLLCPGRYLNANWEQIGEEDAYAEVMMTLDKFSQNSGIFGQISFVQIFRNFWTHTILY